MREAHEVREVREAHEVREAREAAVSPGFGALLYTDCEAGKGLSGSAGLQFQASSPETRHRQATMAVVQRDLLYEPPAAWMRERRPASEYPVMLAHIGEEIIATAHGVYRGSEAGGRREGSHVTHTVVAAGPEAYGLVRPAQLLGAPFWRSTPAASTHIDPLETITSPGRLDTETVSGRVRDHEGGVELLAVLLTALGMERDGFRGRVLFVGEDTEDVLAWIAAATLLLPQATALKIGFKVFTANPSQCRQRIVAVHADSGVAVPAPTANSGYVVVDLTRNEWSPIPADPVAHAWATDFVTDDPYDVVDTVEFAAGTGLTGGAARSVARAVVLHRPVEPDTAAEVLDWLATGPAQLLDEHGEIICDAFVGGADNLPVDLLTRLDRAVSGGRWPGRAVGVRKGLVAAELRAAAAGQAAPPDLAKAAKPREWTGGDQDDAEVRTAWTLRQLAKDRISAVDSILRVAARFGLAPRVDEFPDVAARFAAHWADHPDAGYDPNRWPCGKDMLRILHAELSRRSTTVHSAARLAQTWWHRVLPYAADPHDRFAAAVVTRALQQLTGPDRRRMIVERLRSASQQPDPANAVGRAAALLWPDKGPSRNDARILLDFLPADAALPRRFFQPLIDEINQMLKGIEPLTASRLDVAHQLNERDCFSRDSAKIVGLLRRDAELTALCRRLPGQGAVGLEATCRTLRHLDQSIVSARHRLVAAGLLRNRDLHAVSQMLRALDNHSVELSYARSLEQEMNSENADDAANAAAIAFLIAIYLSAPPSPLARELSESLIVWRKKAHVSLVEHVAEIVSAEGDDEARAWRHSPMAQGMIQKITKIRPPNPFKRD